MPIVPIGVAGDTNTDIKPLNPHSSSRGSKQDQVSCKSITTMEQDLSAALQGSTQRTCRQYNSCRIHSRSTFWPDCHLFVSLEPTWEYREYGMRTWYVSHPSQLWGSWKRLEKTKWVLKVSTQIHAQDIETPQKIPTLAISFLQGQKRRLTGAKWDGLRRVLLQHQLVLILWTRSMKLLMMPRWDGPWWDPFH